MKSCQEAGCWSVGGYETIKCSCFDELVISRFIRYLIDDG